MGPTFFLSAAMFGFVFQMSSLDMEKELKLRQAMEMMGLYDTAYWLSWESMLVFLSSLFIVLFGMLFQFTFFLYNNFAVVFFLFFLFQLSMTSVASMLSAFISNASSTTTVGFFNFIIGFLIMLVTQIGFPYEKSNSTLTDRIRFFSSFYPPSLLAEGIILLQTSATAPQDPGVTWSGRTECVLGLPDCTMTINKIYNWLLSTFIFWFVLAIYFDKVIPIAYGVRKSAFHFLNPGYWTGKGGNKVKEGGLCSCASSVPQVENILQMTRTSLKRKIM